MGILIKCDKAKPVVKLLFISAICSISFLCRNALADDTRVAQWDFDEGSGVALNDSTPFANNGEANAMTWSEDAYAGFAGSFNGNSWVAVPSSGSLDLTSRVTIEVWLKPAQPLTAAAQTIVCRKSDTVQYWLYLQNASIVLQIGAERLSAPIIAGQLPPNVWHKISAEFSVDHTQAILYLDNEPFKVQDGFSAQPVSMETPTYIGGEPDGSNGFHGLIDHLVINNAYIMVPWSPDIYIPDNRHTFQAIAVGAAEVWEFSIYNFNTWPPLTIQSVVSDTPEMLITEPDFSQPIQVSKDQPLTVKVAFKPLTTKTYQGIISVQSDDLDAGSLQLPISGQGIDDDTPYIGQVIPAADQTEVGINAAIYLEVFDAGTGIDPASVQLTIDGSLIAPEFLILGKIDGGLTVMYYPPSNLPSLSTVNLQITAADRSVPPHVMSPYAYQFSTSEHESILPPAVFEAELKPLPNSIAIPVDADISIPVYDTGSGVDPESLIITVNGREYHAGDANVSIQGNASKYIVSILSPRQKKRTLAQFGYGQLVSVTVQACGRSLPQLCSQVFEYAFTTELQAIDQRPVIIVAGNIAEPLTEWSGGSIVLLAVVDDPNGLSDIDNVELIFNGAPTGVFLLDDGSQMDGSAGDGIFGLQLANLPAGIPAGAYSFGIVAKDKSNGYSDPWFIPLVHEQPAVSLTRPSPAKLVIPPFPSITSGAGTPSVLLGGFGYTQLFETPSSLFEVYAVVADAGSGISEVDLLLDGAPTGATLPTKADLSPPSYFLYSLQVPIDVPLTGIPPLHLGLVARDGSGTPGTAFPELVVLGNQAPRAYLLAPRQGEQFAVNETIELQGYGHDPEDGDIPDNQIYWLVDNTTVKGPAARYQLNDLSGIGLHTIACYVLDSLNAYAVQQVSITLYQPQDPAPQVSILNPDNRSFFTIGATIDLSGHGTESVNGQSLDIPGEQLSWYSDKIGFLGTGLSLPTSELPGNAHTITLIGRDDAYREARSSIAIVISPIIACDVTYPEHGQVLCDLTVRDAKAGDRFYMNWFLGTPPSDYISKTFEITFTEDQTGDTQILDKFPGTGSSLHSGTSGRVEVYYNDEVDIFPEQQRRDFTIPNALFAGYP